MRLDDLEPRLRSKIQVAENGCWEWTGTMDRHGYGRYFYKGKVVFSHRHLYRLFVAEPDPLPIDHLCRNRACCNPAHLEAVTHKTNSERGIAGEVNRAYWRNHRFCPQGHPLFGENLYVQITPKGYENKQCRTCKRENARRRWERVKRERAGAA